MVTAIEPIPIQKTIPPKLSCSHEELELIMKPLLFFSKSNSIW